MKISTRSKRSEKMNGCDCIPLGLGSRTSILYLYYSEANLRKKLAIAQLVERWTVVNTLSSIGHWFDSGLRDSSFCMFMFDFTEQFVWYPQQNN